MNTKTLDRLPTMAAVVLIVLVIAACTIHLRGDENQVPSVTSMDQASDPLAAKLEQCRSMTSEQPEALADCRKIWAEKRRQFLDRKAPSISPDDEKPRNGSSLFVPPKDESRFSPGFPSMFQPKE